VAQSNDGGIKLDDEWFNYGQRYAGPRPIAQGQQVEIKYVDWQNAGGGPIKKYINSAVVLPGAAATPSKGKPDPGSFAYRDKSIEKQSALARAIEIKLMQVEAVKAGEITANMVGFLDADVFFLAETILLLWQVKEDLEREPDLDEGPPPEELLA